MSGQTHLHWTWQPVTSLHPQQQIGTSLAITASPQSHLSPPLLLLPKHLPACTAAASQLHDRCGLRECSPAMLLHGPLADQLEGVQS